MSDIVERLRQRAMPDPHDEREVMGADDFREAATEIERLRAELEAARRIIEQAASAPSKDLGWAMILKAYAAIEESGK